MEIESNKYYELSKRAQLDIIPGKRCVDQKDQQNQCQLTDYFQYESQLTTFEKYELKQFSEQLELKDATINELKDKVIDLNQYIDQWIREKQQNEWETAFHMQKMELNNSHKVIIQKEKIIDNLKKHCDKKNEMADKMQIEIEQMSSSIQERIFKAIKQKQEQMQKLELSLKSKEEKIVRILKQSSVFQTTAEDLKKDIEIKQQQLKNIIKSRDDQIVELRLQIKDLFDRISIHEKANYDLRQKLNTINRDQPGYTTQEVMNYLDMCKQIKDSKIMLTLYEKELEQKSAELKRIYFISKLNPQQYDPLLDIDNQFQRRCLDQANYVLQKEGEFQINYLTGAKSDFKRVISKIVIFGESKGVLSQVFSFILHENDTIPLDNSIAIIIMN